MLAFNIHHHFQVIIGALHRGHRKQGQAFLLGDSPLLKQETTRNFRECTEAILDSQTHVSENFCQNLVGANLGRFLALWYRGIPIRSRLLGRDLTLNNHFIIVKELIASIDFHL